MVPSLFSLLAGRHGRNEWQFMFRMRRGVRRAAHRELVLLLLELGPDNAISSSQTMRQLPVDEQARFGKILCSFFWLT
jgi:hypothetical protein